MTEVEPYDGEVVDALPVVTHSRELEPVRVGQVPAVQAAALAATGFLAGAVTVAAAQRRRRRVLRRRHRKGKGLVAEIVSSNSFLVDVHLLRRR